MKKFLCLPPDVKIRCF